MVCTPTALPWASSASVKKHEIGPWANNRVKNSHLPFRRLERAMRRFRQMKSLEKFASVHASLSNHFSLERHLGAQ